MVFKPMVVTERLAFLRTTVDELKKLSRKSRKDLLADTALKWAVEHGLHIAAEAIFDIGNHILTGLLKKRAVGYDLVVGELHKNSVVSSKMVKQFERLGGFRNILVHEYMTVDFDKVYERLQSGLVDFELFIAEITAFLKKQT